MWKQSENIVHRLFSRQVSSGRPNTTIHRARELYENVVPSHTVYEVDCPDQWWRRFTHDGQYLICFSKAQQDLLIYRPLWPTYCSTSDTINDLPSKSKEFESYFSLLHQVPLARGPNEVICKDFFLSTENNLYGIFATSTAPDTNAAATNGAVPGVPCIEKITFLVVRFADGSITGRSVFKDDYIHLAHNAGVFLHDDLLAVLSIRFQRIHILQVRDGGLFLDVRTIGDFCRDDDELILNSQAQAEAKFQEEQRLLRKARGRLDEAEILASVSQSGTTRGKPWTTLIDRKRPRLRDSRASHEDFGSAPAYSHYLGAANGVSHGDVIDVAHEGYFRGLGTGRDGPAADLSTPSGNGNMRILTGGEYDSHANGNLHIRRFRLGVDSASHSNGYNHVRSFPVGRETGIPSSLQVRRLAPERDNRNYEPPSGRRFGAEVLNGSRENLSGRQFSSERGATHETSTFRLFGNYLSLSGSLFSSSGTDVVSHSEPGSSDGTALNEFSSHRDDAGTSERWIRPVSSVSIHGGSIVLPQNRSDSVIRDEPSLGDASVGPSRTSLERVEQTTTSTEISTGRLGQPGPSNSSISHGSGGLGSMRGGATQSEYEAAASMSVDGVPDGRQMLRGLKQRLLSFILQGIHNEVTTPAVKAQQLKRFYYYFQDYMNLVMWKVQFLDRYHLLIKFGSVDGVILRNSEVSHQNSFFAVYNMETTEILAFYPNSSEELLQLVEHYWDHFRVVPQSPLYMNFISSYSNNIFAREQLRKQKAACISGKIGSYAQVIKRTLASLPHNSQSLSPSAYFDQYLFHFDEKLISSTDRHKPCAEHPIKFISRRRPNTLKFKINPGLELGSNDGHIKRVASFLFHPIFPFVISVQQSFIDRKSVV